jgi:hypothetical protein
LNPEGFSTSIVPFAAASTPNFTFAFSSSLDPEDSSDSPFLVNNSLWPFALNTKLSAATPDPELGICIARSPELFHSKRCGVEVVPTRTLGSPNEKRGLSAVSLNEIAESLKRFGRRESDACPQVRTEKND